MREKRRGALPLVMALALALGACGQEPATDDAEPDILITAPDMTPAIDTTAMTRTASGLYYEDLVEGDGYEAVNGQLANVQYTGWLLDAESHPEWELEVDKFDSTLDRGEAFGFELGRGMVIPGWDEGVLGMKVGGVRRLVLPPALAYGEGGRPPIPPNAVLVFDIQLVSLGGVRY